MKNIENMFVIERTSDMHIPVHFVCINASFNHRFQSIQSLFRSLFLLVSVAVSIYSNRLQNTGAKLFCIWNFLSAAFLASTSRPQGPLETVICSRYRCFRTKHKTPSGWLTRGAWSYGWSGGWGWGWGGEGGESIHNVFGWRGIIFGKVRRNT